MTYLSINYARDTGRALNLPTNQRLVLLALSTYTNAVEECWPSTPELTSVTGLSVSAVERARRALIRARAVDVIPRPGRVNRYRFVIHTPVTSDGGRACQPPSPVTAPPVTTDGGPPSPVTAVTDQEQSMNIAPRTADELDPTPIPAWFARKFSHVLEANT